MDHNAGFRAEVFRRHRYRTDLGRLLGAPLLYRRLAEAGERIELQPDQRVVHYFAWRYWVPLHVRYGHEVYRLRRLDESYPNQWIARSGILEGALTMAWHMLLDVPRWFRFSRLLGLTPARRVGLLPLLIGVSGLARGAEMVGIYATMLDHERVARWAQNF